MHSNYCKRKSMLTCKLCKTIVVHDPANLKAHFTKFHPTTSLRTYFDQHVTISRSGTAAAVAVEAVLPQPPPVKRERLDDAVNDGYDSSASSAIGSRTSSFSSSLNDSGKKAR